MINRGITLLILFLSIQPYAQVLPAERAVDWSIAGLKNEIPTPNVIIDFVEAGGVGDGEFVNNSVMGAIIADHVGDTVQVNFPNGVFYFNATIQIPSNFILNGLGADSTLLEFDLGGTNTHMINVAGSVSPAASSPVVGSINKGETSIEVVAVDSFLVGDWVRIRDYDLDNVSNDWGEYNTGQILKIAAIRGEEIEFESPFRRNYDAVDEPYISRMNMKENVMVQNLKLKRLDVADGSSSSIHFIYAANCLVKCIESELTNYAHVRIDFSSNIEVRGSYFYDGHGYGGGGKAYGVVCQLTTGECLVQDNVFEHLRHSMLLQAGANGNVYGYNYSKDPFWEVFPNNAAGDAVLHGNYVYANLFEGNIVQNIVVDNSHGINGPYNTFFRNRAELYGIFMNNSPASDSQNFIGNEIPNEGFLLGLYGFEGVDHFKYGNNHRGENKPEDTDDLTDESYYLDGPLPYFEFYSSWPPIGYPNELEDYNNEAYNNLASGYAIQCDNLYADVSVAELSVEDAQLHVYPNPSAGVITVRNSLNSDLGPIEIYDLIGNLVWQKEIKDNSAIINLDQFENGIYFISSRFGNFKLIRN
ncbi:MAG: T9SS type A sorting domain-containing protein [Crocinitomix sp.]|nr:T9SS type A sorting domain-containing protein [Crocinitomix sp.]